MHFLAIPHFHDTVKVSEYGDGMVSVGLVAIRRQTLNVKQKHKALKKSFVVKRFWMISCWPLTGRTLLLLGPVIGMIAESRLLRSLVTCKVSKPLKRV